MPARSFLRVALAAAAATLVTALPAAPAGAYPAPLDVTGDAWFVHDPSLLIRPGNPTPYVVYATNDVSRVSPDRTAFTTAASALSTTPSWWFTYNTDGHSWAPDVSFHNGKYWMYYAVPHIHSQTAAIGLATSTTGDPGSWVDQGIVVKSSTANPYHAIDPSLLVDASGRWWLTFGSFWGGIYQVQLSPTTGKPSSSKFIHLAQRPVANDPIEGPDVFRHGSYYYLFASFDYCCNGVNSTYNIRVGRSTSPNGPFVDASGVRMLNGGGTMLLASHDDVIGPGGQSVVHDDADGKDLLVYHYYDPVHGGIAKLAINALGWTASGWPYVT